MVVFSAFIEQARLVLKWDGMRWDCTRCESANARKYRSEMEEREKWASGSETEMADFVDARGAGRVREGPWYLTPIHDYRVPSFGNRPESEGNRAGE
ncbi:Hypothetical protein NTJ_07077 [Nesidiocoris tenuis]|uniref:Uncharacterized protein n=1 Tax=Nesidiocoris tenuis TaxID=355587 RepID=A0ABN7AQN1_9HEMI|nr:Hypothetical protein NTJ_07077 [Nesidiocoris tenuis]